MRKVNDNNNLTLADFIGKCDLVVNGVVAELGNDRLLLTDTFNGLIRKLSADVFNCHISGNPKAENSVHNFGSCIDCNNTELLKGLFNYYCNLCLTYNQKPYAIQFCVMINISYNTYKQWLYGNGNVSKELISICRYINQTEEATQVTASDIKSMFRLKSMHGYTETPTQINIITANTEDTAKLLDKYKDLPKLNG